MIPDGLLADRQSPGDFGIAQAFADPAEDLALALGQGRERCVLFVAGMRQAHEVEHLAAEAGPCRLVLEQDVVARVELDELRARDARREQPPFVE
jgi:hypothetical protein